jgi:Uma2 family endonuclease
MSTHEDSLANAALFDLPTVPKQRMTEDEFVAWCFKEDSRAEWAEGELFMMSPVSNRHTKLFHWLARLLGDFNEQRDLGIILGPESQVRFAQQRTRRQPDILFVSNARADRVRENHVEGAPDMIMEIVSPESEARDWRIKYLEYEAAGVREYWVIDPMSEHVELYVLTDKQNYEQIAELDGWLVSSAVTGFRLKTAWLWPATRPKAIDALKELNEPAA